MESVFSEHNTTAYILLLADKSCGSQNIPIKGNVAIAALTRDLHPLLCVYGFPTVRGKEETYLAEGFLLGGKFLQVCVPWWPVESGALPCGKFDLSPHILAAAP